MNSSKTVLITGANSGIGLEAAAQFAEAGFSHVILACRTLEKGEAARTELVQRNGKDVFETLAVDVSETESARKAAQELARREGQLDVLVLNSAMSSGDHPRYNSDGIELAFASTLLGHHALTIDLLNAGKLAADANIVIAGSEGARGNMPTMNVPDFNALAGQHFHGDLEAMHEAIWKIKSPYEYQSMSTYVTRKVYVAWWAATLASKLPAGMTVNAVSPGSVPTTNFARHQGVMMKLMMPVRKLMPRSMGMAAPVADGARRYVDASAFKPADSGKFYASPPSKMVGPLEVQTHKHFMDERNQEASWTMLTRLSQVSLN